MDGLSGVCHRNKLRVVISVFIENFSGAKLEPDSVSVDWPEPCLNMISFEFGVIVNKSEFFKPTIHFSMRLGFTLLGNIIISYSIATPN